MADSIYTADVDTDAEAFIPPVARAITADQHAVIDEVLAALRPGVLKDGGDIELSEIRDNIVRIRLKGACVGCSMSAQTLGGIRRHLVRALDNPGVRVLPALS